MTSKRIDPSSSGEGTERAPQAPRRVRKPFVGARIQMDTPSVAQFMWERAGEGAVVDQQYQWLGKYVLAVMVPHCLHTKFAPFTVDDVATVTGMPAAKCGWILNALTSEGHFMRQVRKTPGETYGTSYYVYARMAPVVDFDDSESESAGG